MSQPDSTVPPGCNVLAGVVRKRTRGAEPTVLAGVIRHRVFLCRVCNAANTVSNDPPEHDPAREAFGNSVLELSLPFVCCYLAWSTWLELGNDGRLLPCVLKRRGS